jgi:hypothetical protein
MPGGEGRLLDPEALFSAKRQLADLEGVQLGERRQGLVQPPDEDLDGRGRTLYLDGGTVGVVANRAREAEALRKPVDGWTEPDSLHCAAAA